MALKAFNVTGGLSVADITANVIESNADITVQQITANGNVLFTGANITLGTAGDTSNAANNPNATVRMLGGNAGSYLTTDGNGYVYWALAATDRISNGASRVAIPVADGNINFIANGNTIANVTQVGLNVIRTLAVTSNANFGVFGGHVLLANANTIDLGNINHVYANGVTPANANASAGMAITRVGSNGATAWAFPKIITEDGEAVNSQSYVNFANGNIVFAYAANTAAEISNNQVHIFTEATIDGNLFVEGSNLFVGNGNVNANGYVSGDILLGKTVGNLSNAERIVFDAGNMKFEMANAVVAYFDTANFHVVGNAIIDDLAIAAAFQGANIHNGTTEIALADSANITITVNSNVIATANTTTLTIGSSANTKELVVHGNFTVSDPNGIVNLSNTANISLGNVANLHIAGGSNGQVLASNGNGNVYWRTIVSSALINASSDVSVYEDANVEFTINGNANVFTVSEALLTTSANLFVTGWANANLLEVRTNAAIAGLTTTGNLHSLDIVQADGNIDGLSELNLVGNANIQSNANVDMNIFANGNITANGSFLQGTTAVFTPLIKGLATSAEGDDNNTSIALNNSNILIGVNNQGSIINIFSNGTHATTTVSDDLVVGGNLAVNGNITYINVETIALEDPLIIVGGGANGANLTSVDIRDRGHIFHTWDPNAATDVFKFAGWDTSDAEFKFGNNVTESNNIVTFAGLANVRAAWFHGNVSGPLANGTSNVAIPVANGNVVFGINSVPNVFTVNETNSVMLSDFYANANVNAGNVTVRGVINLGVSKIGWGNVITTSTAVQNVAVIAANAGEAIELFVSSRTVTGRYSTSTLLGINDGTSADYATYGTVTMGAGTTGALDLVYDTGNYTLQVTPQSSTSTTWEVQWRLV